MADIIAFQTPQPDQPVVDQVWTCGHCGCQTFRLYSDGSSQCAYCDVRSTDSQQCGGWLENLQESPDFTGDKPAIDIIDAGIVDLSRQQTIGFVGPETSVIVVVQNSGAMRGWADIDGDSAPEKQQWLERMLTAAANLLLDRPVADVTSARPE